MASIDIASHFFYSFSALSLKILDIDDCNVLLKAKYKL